MKEFHIQICQDLKVLKNLIYLLPTHRTVPDLHPVNKQQHFYFLTNSAINIGTRRRSRNISRTLSKLATQ